MGSKFSFAVFSFLISSVAFAESYPISDTRLNQMIQAKSDGFISLDRVVRLTAKEDPMFGKYSDETKISLENETQLDCVDQQIKQYNKALKKFNLSKTQLQAMMKNKNIDPQKLRFFDATNEYAGDDPQYGAHMSEINTDNALWNLDLVARIALDKKGHVKCEVAKADEIYKILAHVFKTGLSVGSGGAAGVAPPPVGAAN